MPNHFHGILIINRDYSYPEELNHGSTGGSRSAPDPIKIKPLGQLIGAFKTISTKKLNLVNNSPGEMLWQRNYYEHVIRNDKDLDRIREYILSNPINWNHDSENIIGIS